MKPTWNIARPCTADWNKMTGDDRRRFCEHCRKHVHNVSAMTERERAAFAEGPFERECVTYFRRPDGGIANLSFVAALRRWFPFLRLIRWPALIALLPVIFTGCMGARPTTGTRRVEPFALPVMDSDQSRTDSTPVNQ